ncbi:metallophosphoesterase [Catellatospora citrea]|uniref:metallophosphoesterase n=1 Tax=Catellatospora citrea TaxID=53366 RepID=UPI0033FA5341
MQQLVITIGMATILIGPTHWYLWKRLVKDTTTGARARRIGAVALVVLAGFLLAAFVVPQVFGAKASWIVPMVGFGWLVLVLYLLLVLLVLEVPRAVANRTGARRPAPGRTGCAATAETAVPQPPGAGVPDSGVGPADPSRRLLIARSAAIFAGLTATTITAYGMRTALGDPVLKRVRIPLAKLPRALDGYRIALVSDIHLGPLTGVEHTRRIVRSINGMDPDVIAVVGDLVDGTVAELGGEAAPLAGLRSRDGAYFVTGNHEYVSGAEQWLVEVARLGMRPLQNERLELRGLTLAGVNDVTGGPVGAGGPDYGKALDGRDPDLPVVLLAHQPIQAYQAAEHGVDLQLSGHTHGGQLAPFSLIPALQQPILSGLGEINGTQVYVTNGAGFAGAPVRVGAPPDITLVELRTR